MQRPTVETTVAINGLENSTFTVVAYRKLSDAEIRVAWQVFRSSKAGKRKLKTNSRYIVESIIGFND